MVLGLFRWACWGGVAPSSLENVVGYLLVPVEMSVICLGQVLFRVLGMVL